MQGLSWTARLHFFVSEKLCLIDPHALNIRSILDIEYSFAFYLLDETYGMDFYIKN